MEIVSSQAEVNYLSSWVPRRGFWAICHGSYHPQSPPGEARGLIGGTRVQVWHLG